MARHKQPRWRIHFAVRKAKELAVCEYCGKEYGKTYSYQRFCSVICRNRANHYRHTKQET